MGWWTRRTPQASAEAQQRHRDWEEAFAKHRLPQPVIDRLSEARAERAPWVATMTPAELLTIRSHGCRPIATVSGTCWYDFGFSWTEGHRTGWETALTRIRQEARAAGANAVVDVQMRTLRHQLGQSMDFTLIGTAIRVEGLKASADPIIATVPALEFVQLLEMGIVACGIAVGARFKWLGGAISFPSGLEDRPARDRIQAQSRMFGGNQPLTDLGKFWEAIRRDAHADLRKQAAHMGNGVLAHTHFGQIIQQERDKQPPAYLGRHIVVGTVVDTPFGAPVPHGIEPVVDMRDGDALGQAAGHRHSIYSDALGEREGPI
ncbi:heavy metal-binding domain-containing protein [Sphingomonas sp. ASY06-1R]|uniref:heavy metal-binding domain-containing protein n=1 Tax=Sphingomonas sp. ASY06-1R TaxID=3445771 RepID=UPI003FA34243